MWRDIVLANQDELTKQLQHFRQALDALEYAMKSGNAEALEGLIRAASTARSAWVPGGLKDKSDPR